MKMVRMKAAASAGRMLFAGAALMTALLSSTATYASGDYQNRPEVDQFIEEMVSEHQFSRDEMLAWFADA